MATSEFNANEGREHFPELSTLFYSYRTSELNKKYHIKILSRYRKWNVAIQSLTIGMSAISVALFSILATVAHGKVQDPRMDAVSLSGAVLAAVAFVLSVVAMALGFNQKIDDATTKVHAWTYAQRQIESAIKFIRHSAESRRDAVLQVQFASEAYHLAADIPEMDGEDRKLNEKITSEVNRALPPDYIWNALLVMTSAQLRRLLEDYKQWFFRWNHFRRLATRERMSLLQKQSLRVKNRRRKQQKSSVFSSLLCPLESEG